MQINKHTSTHESELNNLFRNKCAFVKITKAHVDCCDSTQYEYLYSIILEYKTYCNNRTKQYLKNKIDVFNEQYNQKKIERKNAHNQKTNDLHANILNDKIIHNKLCNCGSFPCIKCITVKCQTCNNNECHITVRQMQCCACKDERPISLTGYYKYVDGIGSSYGGARNAEYCPHCRVK